MLEGVFVIAWGNSSGGANTNSNNSNNNNTSKRLSMQLNSNGSGSLANVRTDIGNERYYFKEMMAVDMNSTVFSWGDHEKCMLLAWSFR